jgi:hypothetical protein
MVVWPAEKVTWTQAVALLAADALFDLTPAGRLFDHRLWAQEGASWRPDRGPRGELEKRPSTLRR